MELIDKARESLYNIDAPLVSPEAKAIDKALTTCEEEIAKLKEERNALLEGLKQIANYERDQYESPLYAYDNCKTFARSIIAKR